MRFSNVLLTSQLFRVLHRIKFADITVLVREFACEAITDDLRHKTSVTVDNINSQMHKFVSHITLQYLKDASVSYLCSRIPRNEKQKHLTALKEEHKPNY